MLRYKNKDRRSRHSIKVLLYLGRYHRLVHVSIRGKNRFCRGFTGICYSKQGQNSKLWHCRRCAELVCSIDQLERIDPGAGKLLSAEIEFDKRRLICFVAGGSGHNV